MRTAPLLAAALLLAGCSSDPGAGTTTNAAVAAAATSTAPLAATIDRNNTAPAAVLSADFIAGKAPLNVTFTLAGSDLEGDRLNWALDVDGNGVSDMAGSGLPSTAKYTYKKAGSFHARLAVSDGNTVTVTSLDVEATA